MIVGMLMAHRMMAMISTTATAGFAPGLSDNRMNDRKSARIETIA